MFKYVITDFSTDVHKEKLIHLSMYTNMWDQRKTGSSLESNKLLTFQVYYLALYHQFYFLSAVT